jgi:hypothetical protein
MKDFTAAAVAICGGIIVLCVVIFGGWAAGWWFTTQNTNRSDVLYQQGYAAQNAAEHELSQQIVELTKMDNQIAAATAAERPGLVAQRVAILNQACETAAGITHPTFVHVQWRAVNCGAN